MQGNCLRLRPLCELGCKLFPRTAVLRHDGWLVPLLLPARLSRAETWSHQLLLRGEGSSEAVPHLAPSPLAAGGFLRRIIATGRHDRAVYPQRADPLLSSAPPQLRPEEVPWRSPGPASSRWKSPVHPRRCTHAGAPPRCSRCLGASSSRRSPRLRPRAGDPAQPLPSDLPLLEQTPSVCQGSQGE